LFSQQAILQILSYVEPETVPVIADNYDVSRQHIQKIVNELIAKELVETIDNPAHKRFVLIKRTDKGLELLKIIHHFEQKIQTQMMEDFDQDALKQANDSISKLNMYMRSKTWETIKSQHIPVAIEI